MEVGGWKKTRDHHHTFSLSFLPLDLFLCHILFFFFAIFFLQVTWAGLVMVAPQPPTISRAGGWARGGVRGFAASLLGRRAPRSGVGTGEWSG